MVKFDIYSTPEVDVICSLLLSDLVCISAGTGGGRTGEDDFYDDDSD